MSRVIKIDEQVYEELDQLKAKGETFSGVVQELLNSRTAILDLFSILEGQLRYHQHREARLRELEQQARDRETAPEGVRA